MPERTTIAEILDACGAERESGGLKAGKEKAIL